MQHTQSTAATSAKSAMTAEHQQSVKPAIRASPEIFEAFTARIRPALPKPERYVPIFSWEEHPVPRNSIPKNLPPCYTNPYPYPIAIHNNTVYAMPPGYAGVQYPAPASVYLATRSRPPPFLYTAEQDRRREMAGKRVGSERRGRMARWAREEMQPTPVIVREPTAAPDDEEEEDSSASTSEDESDATTPPPASKVSSVVEAASEPARRSGRIRAKATGKPDTASAQSELETSPSSSSKKRAASESRSAPSGKAARVSSARKS